MTTRVHTRALALGAAALVAAAVAAVAVPGTAGASGGDGGLLLVKALGSRYTDAQFVSGVGRPGRTQTFQLLVNNTTGVTTSFDLTLTPQDGAPVSWGFYDHHRFVPETEYSTPMIPDGGSLSVQAVAIPNGAGPGEVYSAELTMTPDANPESVLADKELIVSMVAPPIGTGGILTMQAAGQAAVGGDDLYEPVASSTALVAPKSATYKVTVVNNSGGAANVDLGAEANYDGSCDDSFVTTIKVGGFDVTYDVFNFAYASPLVGPGATVTFNVTVKYASATDGCNAQYLTFLASDGVNETIGSADTLVAFAG